MAGFEGVVWAPKQMKYGIPQSSLQLRGRMRPPLRSLVRCTTVCFRCLKVFDFFVPWVRKGLRCGLSTLNPT